jgi:hypothetical protein
MRAIGYLSPRASEPSSPFMSVFLRALIELGWTEGKNVTFERRFAGTTLNSCPDPQQS